MRIWNLAIVCAALFLTGNAHSEDEPVTLYTFGLQNGKSVAGYSYQSSGSGALKTYLVGTPDGKKLVVLEREVVSRAETRVPLASPPEKLRKEVLARRAAAATARAEAEAQAKDDALAAAARQKETSARATLKMAEDDLALAKTVLNDAEKIVKDAPVELARLDAQYDAAKTELGGLTGSGYPGSFGYGADHRRADYLRGLMTHAAEDKARLELSQKEATDVIARVRDAVKTLDARIETAQNNVESAQDEVKAALKQAKEAAKARQKARETKHQAASEMVIESRAGKQPSPVRITLKNGAEILATTVIVDPEGNVTAKDTAGKVHYLSPKEIAKREEQPGAGKD